MTISRNIINTIRDRAPIEDIARRYIPSLRKRGNSYVGLCPFHKDSNPSFTISPEKKIFHCFGCNTGGNVFSFISKIEGLSFPESVRFLGDLVGIQVADEPDQPEMIEIKSLLEMNASAMKRFSAALRSDGGKAALQYLYQRGLTDNDIEEFQIGYAPESWDFIKGHCLKNGFSPDKAVKIGLLNVSEKEGKKHYYDRFRDRIIFPIVNQNNEVIAFGARAVGGGKVDQTKAPEAKYINSPESEIFSKRNVLYGFNVARKHISDLKRAIVVEGYLDVIAFHHDGVKNVVASLGTALTNNQVALLSRHAGEIVLLFDSDWAGRKASLRSLDLLRDKNVSPRVAMLPELDPFDYIKKHGIRKTMALVDTAVDPVDFQIQQVIREYGTSDRMKTLLRMFEIIRDLGHDSEKDLALKKIAELLDIDEKAVRADYGKSLKGAEAGVSAGDRERDAQDFLARSYRSLVLLLCSNPELIQRALMDFTAAEIDDPVSKDIFQRLIDEYSSSEIFDTDAVFNLFPDGEEKKFLESNLVADIPGNPDDLYTDIYINVKRYALDRDFKKYTDLVKKSGSDSSGPVKEYLAEIEVLKREKEKLRNYMYNKRSH